MKKLFVALFLLIPTVILAGGPTVGGFGFGGNPRNAQSYAFFEAFPASGAGVPTVCSTTAPTGARGQALTFTRASSATCTKTRTGGGLATTGIANGDLVVLSSNQPRVEYGSDGVLGLLVESSRTNSFLRSEEFDNAAWSLDVGVTVTANAATAPDGTTTADRVQFAGGAAVLNRVSQLDSGIGAGAWVATVYIKGNGTSGTIYLWDDGSATNAAACSYVSSSWTKCSAITTSPGGSAYFAFGCRSSFLGMPATCPTNDVFAWGAQGEQGAYATSYIPTTSAAVTRSAEDAYFATASAPGLNTGSMAASVTYNYSANSYTTPVAATSSTSPASSGANSFTLYSQGTNGTSFRCYAGDNGVPTVYVTGAANLVAPFTGIHRGWCSASGNGSTVTGGFDTNSMSASGTIAGAYASEAYLFVGGSKNTLTYADGIISRVCRDPSPTRCR